MDWKLRIENLILDNTLSNKLPVGKSGYKQCGVDSQVALYKRGLLGRKIVAAFADSMVMQSFRNKNVLYYYSHYKSCIRKRIVLNDKTFPGLIPCSSIDQVMLLPYMRVLGPGRYAKQIRLVIITNKCQVFHNCPARSKEHEGQIRYGDDARFEESAIWDIPGRKYPSKSQDVLPVERFFPYLPETTYEYHPCLNSSKTYVDKYHNGGFGASHKVIVNGKEEIVSRFYFPKRTIMCNSFHHIGGEEPDYKMTVIGTYRANNGGNGARTVIFATDDGGRNWFAKYEFGDFGSYEFAQGAADWRTGFGNPIKFGQDFKQANGILSIIKRTVITPTNDNKEPSEFFKWSAPVDIVDIANGKSTAVVKTATPHGLETGNVIAVKSSGAIFPFVNNDITPCSGGNGVLFKVSVIDDNSFELYEFVHSPDNPICCRHIHQVNRVKDGWLIGTGEIYPNGWLLYMQMKEADTFSIKHAWEDFDIYRLNSTKESVQRTLGAILLDDSNQSLIFASDHDTLERNTINTTDGRSFVIRRNSTGIFKGKLVDIDNRNKFEVLYEAKEPSFLFKNIANHLVFAGQRGELAISNDLGNHWRTYQIDTDTYDYHGTVGGMIVLGEYLIKIQ